MARGHLGEIIRRQREIHQLSMRQFAALAGISNPYLSQIEHGLREPSARVLEAIADALQTSTADLWAAAGVDPEADAEASPTIAAIEADEGLTARQRRALIETYEAFVALNSVPGSGRGRGR